MDAQRIASTEGAEDVARGLWASMFRGNWLLFSANVALYLAQAVITLAFAYILKQTFDAVAAGSLGLLVQTGQVVALLLAAELATDLAVRASLPAFLRRAVSGYRHAVFDRLLGKGIGAFDGGGASYYESALTNDVTTIDDLPRVIYDGYRGCLAGGPLLPCFWPKAFHWPWWQLCLRWYRW